MEQTLYLSALLTRCLYDEASFKGVDRGFTENCGYDYGHGDVVNWIDCPEYCVDWYDNLGVI